MSVEPSADELPIVLEYQLLEGDVRCYQFRHYPGLNPHLLGQSGWICRGRKKALLLLALLALFLFATCWHHANHPRPAFLAIGVILAFLMGSAAFHFQEEERRFLRIVAGMGLPDDCRVHFSPGGITVEGQSDLRGRGWHDSWPGVRNVGTARGLTYLRFRRSGWVLIVPDRVFASPEARTDFVEHVRAWQERGKSRAGSG